MKDIYSIPVVLNITIIVICTSLFFFLFQAGAQTPVIGYKILLGLAFGIIMIPVYSLMHESAHNSLHPNKRMNTFLGQVLSTLFAVSCHFFGIATSSIIRRTGPTKKGGTCTTSTRITHYPNPKELADDY